jgi:hypothetical protein
MYLINVIIFNEIHLRRKNERVGWVLLYVYYLPYKIVLTAINVASCYWSLYKYARYFAKRHPKVIEDEKAVEVVIRLEEDQKAPESGLGRRMTVRTVGARPSGEVGDNGEAVSPLERVETGGGVYRIVTGPTEPEQAHVTGLQPVPTHVSHTAPSSPMLRNEGVAAVDYFAIAQQTQSNEQGADGNLEKQEKRWSANSQQEKRWSANSQQEKRRSASHELWRKYTEL